MDLFEMEFTMKFLFKAWILLWLFTAEQPSFSSGISASLYGGYNHMSSDEKTLQLPDETDRLVPTRGGDGFIGGVGLGYRFEPHSSFINAITVGPEVFLFNTHRRGPVWQFQDPTFANYNYSIKVNTARVMLDGWLDFQPWFWGINPVIGAGLGAAQVKTQYHEPIIDLFTRWVLEYEKH
jgi:hypothetical protein